MVIEMLEVLGASTPALDSVTLMKHLVALATEYSVDATSVEALLLAENRLRIDGRDSGGYALRDPAGALTLDLPDTIDGPMGPALLGDA
jgi:hypothetical protein